MRKSERQKKAEEGEEKNRQRSQKNRDEAKTMGKPPGSAVDRAIVRGAHIVWYGQVKAIAGNDRQLQREVTCKPINMWRVADEALNILVRDGFDRWEAGVLLMRRLRPRDPLNGR